MTNQEARRAILRCIIKAQIASDAGKNKKYKWPCKIRNYNRLLRDGYKEKDRLIIQAVKLINQFPKAGIEYYYTKNADEIYDTRYDLVYFSFALDNERLQVSFHCPFPGLKIPASKDSYAVYWDGYLNGSRYACFAACEYAFNMR